MITDLSALLDLADLAGCPPALERHHLDCLVRWLLEHGWQGEPLDIQAGIGRLQIGNGSTLWEPATKPVPNPPPLPATPEQVAERRIICDTCSRYKNDKCEVAGCGCSGLGLVSNRLSKCPLGKW